ncbi:hypothetical protein DVH24_003811 [Malus domestica]|uniref:Uncharacterized protein n=1 Tax=Malus domestica TaxID=3750 RepID=A0A498K4H6_MALDO|nr:hypothetical protein DVH24_003811 [Malus domestica]
MLNLTHFSFTTPPSRGIPLSDLDLHPVLDSAIDSTDEVDLHLNIPMRADDLICVSGSESFERGMRILCLSFTMASWVER